MAEVKAAEVSAILKKQIEGFDASATLDEVGTVLAVGDGIARIYGLTEIIPQLQVFILLEHIQLWLLMLMDVLLLMISKLLLILFSLLQFLVKQTIATAQQFY